MIIFSKNISDIKNGWILYADCEILYDGRASSTLERGNFLIIYKNDRSVSIHGSDQILPRNYMGQGSTCSLKEDKITFIRKSEKIIIKIYNEIHFQELQVWSDNKTKMRKTEHELTLKIIDNWFTFFGDNSDVEFIYQEYSTSLGPIDILARSATTDYIIETKRKNITLKDITQLRRYVEAMADRQRIIKAYVAGPRIGKRAIEYLATHNLYYLKVDFDL